MFLTNSHRGYTRDGQQRASGRFLILFSHNKYKMADEMGLDWRNIPKDFRRTLYAHVCHVSMKQLGHFMMGEAKTLEVQGKAWKHLIVSGTYGGDGLPCDYENLTSESRKKLRPVPPALADKFWQGGGWNGAGSEVQEMRDWAIKEFKVKPR